MKILMTGFEPFGDEEVNPAWEAVKQLPERMEGAEIFKIEIPTVFETCAAAVEEGIRKYEPDIVISVGQAGGRSSISIEKIAINLSDARIPDNAGDKPEDKRLEEDGDTACFSTLPVKKMIENIREHGIPASISYSAGTYVCNCVMYRTLYLADKKYRGMKCGFIHVPYMEQQAAAKPEGTPSMSLETIVRGLVCAIQAAVKETEKQR